jgi:catecholate siderophore receptor
VDGWRQQTNGYEIGVNGRLAPKSTVAGGYGYQNAFVSSATATATLNTQVAQVPHNTLSLWNNDQFWPRRAAAIGVLYRRDMLAGIDNAVTLSGYARGGCGLLDDFAAASSAGEC